MAQERKARNALKICFGGSTDWERALLMLFQRRYGQQKVSLTADLSWF